MVLLLSFKIKEGFLCYLFVILHEERAKKPVHGLTPRE